MASNVVLTASGRELTLERMVAAADAVSTIALNNSLLLQHSYQTSREDVEALVELAQQKFYELSRKGGTRK